MTVRKGKDRVVVAFATAILLSSLCAGCSNQQSSALPSSQQKAVDRTTQLEKQTGGDWNKLSQNDKDYLTKSIGDGSPKMAQQVFAFAGRKPMAEPPPPNIGSKQMPAGVPIPAHPH